MSVEFEDRSEVGTIAVTTGPPARILLVGDFDAANTDEVTDAFAAVPASDVILDMVHVTFCCSPFLTCLLRFQQRIVGEGHQFRVCGMSAVMSRLLTVTGTERLFPMITDR